MGLLGYDRIIAFVFFVHIVIIAFLVCFVNTVAKVAPGNAQQSLLGIAQAVVGGGGEWWLRVKVYNHPLSRVEEGAD